LLILLVSVNFLQAKPYVIERKVLSESPSLGANLFIDKDNNAFVVTDGPSGEDYIWLNDTLVPLKKYGGCLNGFIKDGRMHLASLKDKNIDICLVEKNLVLENRTAIEDFPAYPGIERLIYVAGDSNIFYLLGSRQQLPRNPGDFMTAVLSGGHGLYYEKPVWAEIKNQKLLEYQKIPYGGKIDESFDIKEVLTGENTIYFFGFRILKRYREQPTSVLHYAEYNVKKKKVMHSQDIYKETPDSNKNDTRRTRNLYVELSSYWHISANNFNNDLFIVFSWQGFHFSRVENSVPKKIIENMDSPIYYSQNNGKIFDNPEMIGQGILPLVKTDSLGNVYVIWSNSKGDIVYKAKKEGKWSDEQIILSNAIDSDKVWERSGSYKTWLSRMSADFDKDNHLHIVFTSNGMLTYAKIILN
jgi:hypothetical protein